MDVIRTSQGAVRPRSWPVPGMRSVRWVRITVFDGRAHCEAVGTGHRRPVVREVSLQAATALSASGVPVIVRSGDRRRASTVSN